MDITLKWDDLSNDEDGFHIYRSIDGAPEELRFDASPNGTEQVDLGAAPGTYVYSISAFNSFGESARIASNKIVVPFPLSPRSKEQRRR